MKDLSCIQDGSAPREDIVIDISMDCTSIARDVLTRLIAAARVTESVAWSEAESEAGQEITALWGAPAETPAPVEVSTEVLIQLVAAAVATVSAPFACGADWAAQVHHDLTTFPDLTAPAVN